MNGKIRLTHVNSNLEDDYYLFQLSDNKSGSRFLHIKLSAEQLGQLVGSSMDVDMEFNLIEPQRVGKVIERKTVTLTFSTGVQWRSEKTYTVYPVFWEQLKPYTDEGWIAYSNQSQRTFTENGKTVVSVNLVRYVDEKEVK